MARKPANAAAADPQEELALSSIRAHAVFPGRATLYVFEVAAALHIDEKQVIDLIEGGQLKAVDISSGLKKDGIANGNKTPRKYWRIPVSAYDEFISRRQS